MVRTENGQVFTENWNKGNAPGTEVTVEDHPHMIEADLVFTLLA